MPTGDESTLYKWPAASGGTRPVLTHDPEVRQACLDAYHTNEDSISDIAQTFRSRHFTTGLRNVAASVGGFIIPRRDKPVSTNTTRNAARSLR